MNRTILGVLLGIVLLAGLFLFTRNYLVINIGFQDPLSNKLTDEEVQQIKQCASKPYLNTEGVEITGPLVQKLSVTSLLEFSTGVYSELNVVYKMQGGQDYEIMISDGCFTVFARDDADFTYMYVFGYFQKKWFYITHTYEPDAGIYNLDSSRAFFDSNGRISVSFPAALDQFWSYTR